MVTWKRGLFRLYYIFFVIASLVWAYYILIWTWRQQKEEQVRWIIERYVSCPIDSTQPYDRRLRQDWVESCSKQELNAISDAWANIDRERKKDLPWSILVVIAVPAFFFGISVVFWFFGRWLWRGFVLT